MLTFHSIRARRSTRDPIFRRGWYWALAGLLTGKRDVKSLDAHCARTGVGSEEVWLAVDRRVTHALLMEAQRRRGLLFSNAGDEVLARMEDGVFVDGDPALTRAVIEIVRALPPSDALVWTGNVRVMGKVTAESVASAKAAARAVPKAAPAPKVTAKVRATAIVELATAEDVKRLSALQRAQLTKASPALNGKPLAKLFASLREDETVVLARLDVDGAPRWDAWLMGALEDGVFFAHGKKVPSGLTMSQGGVRDETTKRREDDVRVIAAAMKTLRMPRRVKKRAKRK